VSDPEIWAKAVGGDGTVGIRSDIYTLRTYLEERKMMSIALMQRNAAGGSGDIKAQSNWDLKSNWDAFVMGLLEADTKFAWTFNRFFATDMGFNLDTAVSPERQQELQFGTASLMGEQPEELGSPTDMFNFMEGTVTE
jgi:hypothetical protein